MFLSWAACWRSGASDWLTCWVACVLPICWSWLLLSGGASGLYTEGCWGFAAVCCCAAGFPPPGICSVSCFAAVCGAVVFVRACAALACVCACADGVTLPSACWMPACAAAAVGA